MFADILKTPAAQSLAWRLENGGAFSFSGVAQPAQPFFAALLQNTFPRRPIVVVTENLKKQESFQQDLETWLGLPPLFYPNWEIFPHENKLPHADVISERLQTLVSLSEKSAIGNRQSKIVVTNIVALLQKTFPPDDLKNRTRQLQRGNKIVPLDLIEWLEEQGYEPEAQVSQKGEIALRGGIVDIFPPTCPWPARLEFFGDELESLRHFDPQTQISRGEISEVTIPPAGELGILKSGIQKLEAGSQNELATLLDYLSRETIVVFCEPESLAVHAENYEKEIPANDPFFISWEEIRKSAEQKQFSVISLAEGESENRQSAAGHLQFSSLETFRPLIERAVDPQIAEAQRREFFQQIHRWLRQNYSVHIFCNNDGERQRFEEIWKDCGFAVEKNLQIQIGNLSRGFICDEAKRVVVTDAEIFGRYKIQRPRKLKSLHALAARSALDIDFTDLEEGDLVVHLQYGIGKFLGLKNLPATTEKAESGKQKAEIECLVIEYAPSGDANEPPKLYVPVSESHLVSKYVGAGKAHPPLNTLSGTRWQKAKEQTEKAVRDVAAELLRIQAARETQAGHAFKSDSPWQREFESAFIYEETPDQVTAISETKADMEKPKPMDR
ncbi:MAG TPA: CarD family transcriptional regulator, partial [Verrucomicrobiae bacterium]|nr:CarD family transcriptional regulator [Verrucomicrobiae bacterium]